MDIDTENNYSDEKLATLSLENKRYFVYLIDRYEQKIRRYIYRLGVRSQEDIDDVLQDVFIKVYQNLNAFDPSLKFSSWLYRIAHNETISSIRYKKARPHGNAIDISDDELHNISSEINIIKETERKHTTAHLKECINQLDEKYRDILILKFLEEKSYEEVSDILRIPQGTVAVRINRAKEKIKVMMKEKGYIYE